MAKGYSRPAAFTEARTHYCAGCGHGIVHRLLAEVIEERGIREKTIGMAPVGCAVLAYNYLEIDMCEAPHGRTPAVATGIKRADPEKIVFSYQGDGDLMAIGTAEIIHAANRGEDISVFFVNNAVYGMTSGQMAPTTPVGAVTSTTPRGRNRRNEGGPIRVCELLATLEGSAFLARGSVSSPRHVRQLKKYFHRAFETQEQHRGFSLVEVLSPRPTYWRMSPVEAMAHIDAELTKVFPPGVIKDWSAEEEA